MINVIKLSHIDGLPNDEIYTVWQCCFSMHAVHRWQSKALYGTFLNFLHK